jgi:hypothetical protein
MEPGIGDSDDDSTDAVPAPPVKKATEDLILKKAIEVAQK